MPRFKLRAKAVYTPPLKLPSLTPAQREYVVGRAVSENFIESEGWHLTRSREGDRIGIPVRDADGVVVNTRRHLPGATERKTVNTRGQGSPTRLAGMDRLGTSEWIIVTGRRVRLGLRGERGPRRRVRV